MDWSQTVLTDDGGVALVNLPLDDLISAALLVDENTGWDYVSVIRLRADEDTFDRARRLCDSDDPAHRALGVDILRGLGDTILAPGPRAVHVPEDQRRFRAAGQAILLDLAERETATAVLRTLGPGLGGIEDSPPAVAVLGRLREHPDRLVRWGVTGALGGHAKTDDTALGHLLAMTTDPDAVIRDWACFEIGLSGRDTEAVRDVLVTCLADEDAIVRTEAVQALADLGDDRAVPSLVDALSDRWPARVESVAVPLGDIEAAARRYVTRTGEPRLAALLSSDAHP